MSINNGRQRNKKGSAPNKASNNAAAPTNTVHPILRHSQQKVPSQDVANGNNNCSRISRGQVINPKKTAVQPRIVTTVADFVSEVIPQSSNPAVHTQNEQIQWVRIQKCPLDQQQRQITFIVIVGLARGYQVWMMLENGNCEEIVSERRGPLKLGHLLPVCPKSSNGFQKERPLLALVDGNPMCAENKFCQVEFLSLKTAKTVYTLKYNEPVMDLSSTNNAFIVVLSESIIVYNNDDFTELCSFMVPPSSDPSMPPVYAVSDCFLAFVDSNLNSSIQSCGGRVDADDNSYSGQVINAAKTLSKTVTSISETLVSSFSTQTSEKRNNILIDPGVVSVINLNGLPCFNDAGPINNHFIAHFVAHQSGVGYIAFGSGGRLLFTSNETANTFNIFVLQPHPVNCRLSSVQHIYTLHRGNSAAKVVDAAFTNDNRWIAVATNHGTTHLFAICPYGGVVCMRTHSGRFIKESVFERTAGLMNAENQISFNVHSKPPISSTFVDHPALSKNPIVSRTIVNPRITRFPPPIVLWSYAKIKQHILSAENLSAWASDNTPVSLTNPGKIPMVAGQPFFESHRRLALCFGTAYGDRSASGENPVLFVMNSDGMLYQYKIEIRRERLNSSGSVSSLNNDIGGLSPNSDSHKQYKSTSESGKMLEAPIQIRTVALSCWQLTRLRGTTGVNFVSPPLHETSPILKIIDTSNSQKRASRKNSDNNSWLQHVEVKTYSSPHRRLWMGPQFTFGIYNSQKHASAELVSPSTENKPIHMFTTAQKCCPVLIEKNSDIGILLHCDTETSRIVCGHWPSDSGLYSNGSLATLKEQLEDAMRDQRQMNGQPDSYSTPGSSSSSK